MPGPWVGGNYYLTLPDQQINARYIWDYLRPNGWTLNAVAGMLGNMEEESTINPGVWEDLTVGTGGFGLVQWTPASKLIDWAQAQGFVPESMNTQLQRIMYEEQNPGVQWINTTAYPLSFTEFKNSLETPYYLALAFSANYERPDNPNQPERGDKANVWYDFLNTAPPVTGRKLPLIYYSRRREVF